MTFSNNDIIARLWDFGGQEIMHATHQFFLSKRSLYILVLDGRKDKKIDYWLKLIHSFGGDSPIIVVINKIDENRAYDVNRQYLADKYPSIKTFHRVSCLDGEGIGALARDLEQQLAQLEMARTTWPKSWFDVKSKLEAMTIPYITYNDYRVLCDGESLTEAGKQDLLLEFLHDLGVVLHFRTLNLQDTQVLMPEWVTEAVYRIINSGLPAESGGILRLDMLTEILKPGEPGQESVRGSYPPEKFPFIIALMKQFEICYPLAHDENRVLLPDLLPVAERRNRFDEERTLKFIIQYDFLPHSVLPRFIVRLHRDIKEGMQWRTGVVLCDESFGATAEVKADEGEREITIEVGGERKRDYFSVIRKAIRDINGSFEKLKTTEWVPLPDNDEIKIEYDELIGHEIAGEREIFIGKLRKKYNVSQLLDGIESKEEREDRMKDRVQKGDQGIHFAPKIEVNPHIEVKPDNKQIVNVTTTTTQTNEQTQEFNITVDLPGMQEAIEELKDILLEQKPGMERRLGELGNSWDGLREDGEKEKFTAPMNKMKRLVETMSDSESGIGEILSKTQQGIRLAQKVGRTYNKFAQWLALPQVPDVFLGKD